MSGHMKCKILSIHSTIYKLLLDIFYHQRLYFTVSNRACSMFNPVCPLTTGKSTTKESRRPMFFWNTVKYMTEWNQMGRWNFPTLKLSMWFKCPGWKCWQN
jgi:hypothetical protein